MNRIVNDLNAIEFDEFYLTVAKYKDVGWQVDKVFTDKVNAAERIHDLINKEFNSEEVAIRIISGSKKRDIKFDDMKDCEWFEPQE